MFSKFSFGSRNSAPSKSLTSRLGLFRAHLEPLEERKLLTATALINEIYFDPPGSGGDLVQEYIELRGTPGMSLENHYLIFLENENNALNTGNPGMVERIFDLGDESMGSNGFLTLRQKSNPFTVAPGTTDLVNTGSGAGWGAGPTSSLNVQAEDDRLSIENSGFTVMLIVNNGGAPSVPFIGQDLDVDNDGLDVATGHVDWTILDSIGIHSEAGEAEFGRLYAPINFGPDETTNIELGATYVGVGYEIEYVGRYGNSTGQTAADWHISNLTDNVLSGYTGMGDFRQSGTPHGSPTFVESNQGVPYGTNLTKTLGAPNFPFGPSLDLNGLALDTGYASTWNNSGAIAITDAAAATIFQGDNANLVSLTATVTAGADPNNILSADTTGTPISQSYNAGSGVLTLSGTATKAEYQQVLRTVKYDNTAGGPGAGSVTVDFVGNDNVSPSATVTSSIAIEVPLNSTVVGRHLFYNQSGTASRYDGNNLAINASDDNAIATDKTAYLWENPSAATFANVSSYSKGINGIMIDLADPHGTIGIDDFIFRVGNNNSPGTWGTANAPSSISVRAGAGVSGSDRVTIIWAPGTAPIKQWLQVITLANADTGLAQAPGYPVGHGDHFFFGNALGNSGLGDTAINATVNATDEIEARNNPANLAANIPITNIRDYDRNAQVNASDQIIARNNATNPTTVLKYLNLTTAPAAPEADGGDEISPLTSSGSDSGDSGVASALTAPVTSSEEIKVPGWIKNRLDSIDLNSGVPARVFQQWHDVNTPGTRKLLQKVDAIADSLGLDDTLLEELLADLGL